MTANWEKRSSKGNCSEEKNCSGLKFGTMAPTAIFVPLAISASGPMADRPALRDDQKSATVVPRPEIAPNPVTTTRLVIRVYCFFRSSSILATISPTVLIDPMTSFGISIPKRSSSSERITIAFRESIPKTSRPVFKVISPVEHFASRAIISITATAFFVINHQNIFAGTSHTIVDDSDKNGSNQPNNKLNFIYISVMPAEAGTSEMRLRVARRHESYPMSLSINAIALQMGLFFQLGCFAAILEALVSTGNRPALSYDYAGHGNKKAARRRLFCSAGQPVFRRQQQPQPCWPRPCCPSS